MVAGGQCSRERMEILKKTEEVLSCKCPWLLAQGNTVYNDEDVWTCGMSCSAPVVKAALITCYVNLVIRAANLNLFSLLLIVDLAMTTILPQYYSDANEAESWMKEKEPLVTSDDYGRDEASAKVIYFNVKGMAVTELLYFFD